MTVDAEKMKAQRVEACIADVMERFPRDSKEYYVEVHQHLAPLARQLERERDELRVDIERLCADVETRNALLRALNAVAIERGDKSGACDSTDNGGNPYQSQHLADVLAIGAHTKTGREPA
jgi:hypothetical protein